MFFIPAADRLKRSVPEFESNLLFSPLPSSQSLLAIFFPSVRVTRPRRRSQTVNIKRTCATPPPPQCHVSPCNNDVQPCSSLFFISVPCFVFFCNGWIRFADPSLSLPLTQSRSRTRTRWVAYRAEPNLYFKPFSLGDLTEDVAVLSATRGC